jgi:hypothetical protein
MLSRRIEELKRLFLFPDELTLELRDFYLAALDISAEILKKRGLCTTNPRNPLGLR